MPRKDNRLKSNPRFPGSGLPALAPSRSEFIGTVALKTCESLTHYSCGTAVELHHTSPTKRQTVVCHSEVFLNEFILVSSNVFMTLPRTTLSLSLS